MYWNVTKCIITFFIFYLNGGNKLPYLSDNMMNKVGLVSNISDWIVFFSHVGTLEKYTEGKWRPVLPEDQLKLNKHDGQVWMALLNLMLKPDCQRKYDFNSFNKAQLLKVRLYIAGAISLLAEPFYCSCSVLNGYI